MQLELEVEEAEQKEVMKVVMVEDQIKTDKVLMVMKELLEHKIQVQMEEMGKHHKEEILVQEVVELEDITEEVLEHNLIMTFHQLEEVAEVQI